MNAVTHSRAFEPALPITPDQPEAWTAHTRAAIPFAEATNAVLEAHARDGARADVEIPVRGWCVAPSSTDSSRRSSLALAPVPGTVLDGFRPMPLRRHAFRQLTRRIEAPTDYVGTLPARLQLAALNYGFAVHDDETFLVRMAGDEIRAVLSTSFTPIDDVLVLEVVDAVLGASGLRDIARVRSIATGPLSTCLRITVPSLAEDVRPGDAIEYGFDVRNSETGAASLSITPVTYRLVCSNGLRAWSSSGVHTRLRHVGDPRRLRESLRAAIPAALADARGDVDRLRQAIHVMIDDAAEEIARLRSFGFTNPEVDAVKRELVSDASSPVDVLDRRLKGARVTAFDLTNAATAVARTRPSNERRLELESASYVVLRRHVR